MTDRIEIPWRAFNDRRVTGSHLRALAALCHAGEGVTALAELSASCGLQQRGLRRLVRELQAYGYVAIEERAGQESSYIVIFTEPRMKDTQGEKVTQAEKTFTPQPSTTLSPDVPLSLSPEPLEPFPPLIPQSPREIGARATRLPLDWKPDESDWSYAVNAGLRDIPAIVIDFCDYWHARAGPDARKVSWAKTWRRWVRTAKQRQDQADERQRRSNGNSRGGPATGYFEGAAMLIADLESGGTKRPPNPRTDFNVAEPLLDS